MRVRYGIYACFLFILTHSLITNYTVNEREKRVVFTDAYVRAGMNLRASLTNKNVARKHLLTVAALRAKTFRFTVSAVVRRTRTFLMSE